MNVMFDAVSDAAVIAKRNVIKIKRVPEVLVVRAAVADHVRAVVLLRLRRLDRHPRRLLPRVSDRRHLRPDGRVRFDLHRAGLAEDIQKGIMNRFRSLPMSRSALLVGRTDERRAVQRGVAGDHGADRAVGRMADRYRRAAGGCGILPAAAVRLRLLLDHGIVGLMVPSVEVINNATFMVTCR